MTPSPKSMLIIGIHAKPKDATAITFPAPQGFHQPDDNAQEGATFESLATLKMTSDGMVQLVAIDGLPVSKDPKEMDEEDADTTSDDQQSQQTGAPAPDADEEPEDPDNGDFIQAIRKGLAKKK